jgi:hypothetical protein
MLINEVDSDTPGADAAEFVELYDGGTGNTDLGGLVVVFFNGNGDTSYAAYDLDGRRTNAQGYFLLGNGGLSPDVTFANGLLQNGADAVALYEANAADFPGGTPVTSVRLVDAIVYDTSDADDPGLLPLLNPGELQVNENEGGVSAEDSIQRCPNGTGGPRNTSTYAASAPSPAAPNVCCHPPGGVSDLAASITTARQVALSWTAITRDTRGNGITGVTYNVYRSQDDPYFSPGSSYATGLADPTFIDPGRDVVDNPGHATYYVVAGVYNTLVATPSNCAGAFAFGLAPGGR